MITKGSQSAAFSIFFATCLCACAAIRLLMRRYEWLCSLPVGVSTLITGAMAAWWALQRYRNASRFGCAAALGLCSAVAGSGLFTLLVHGILLLLPSHWGPMPRQ